MPIFGVEVESCPRGFSGAEKLLPKPWHMPGDVETLRHLDAFSYALRR